MIEAQTGYRYLSDRRAPPNGVSDFPVLGVYAIFAATLGNRRYGEGNGTFRTCRVANSLPTFINAISFWPILSIIDNRVRG